jgi:hypothetical protein
MNESRSAGEYEWAVAVFRAHGVEAGNLTVDELRRARRQIAMMAHPDHGGSGADMSEVNAAHDLLKRHALVRRDPNGASASSASSSRPAPASRPTGQARAPERRYTPAPSRREDPGPKANGPEWAKAGAGGRFSAVNVTIRRQDFSDRNFLTKWFWDHSTGPRSSFHVQAFAGPVFTGLKVATSPDLEERLVQAVAELFHAENDRDASVVVVHGQEGGSRLWILSTMRAIPVPSDLGTPGKPGYAEKLQAIVAGATRA